MYLCLYWITLISPAQSPHQAQIFWAFLIYIADFWSHLGKWVNVIKIEALNMSISTLEGWKPQNNTSTSSFHYV